MISDKSMKDFGSHYFQSAEEMGYYGFEIEDFKSLIKHLTVDDNPSAIFTPAKMEVNFDGTLTNKVYNWAINTELPFIYINGMNDTWSATSIPENISSGSLWFNLKEKHHGNARIKNFDSKQLNQLKTKLTSWLNQEIKGEIN